MACCGQQDIQTFGWRRNAMHAMAQKMKIREMIWYESGGAARRHRRENEGGDTASNGRRDSNEE